MASNVRRKQIRLGNQIPRIDIYQPGDTTKAELLFELMEEYGDPYLEWQKLVLRRWLAEDEDGNFVNPIVMLDVSRQNGKTKLIRGRIIYGIIFRKAIGLYTSQLQDTSDEVKREVQNFFYENPHEEIFNLLTPRFQKKPKNYDYMEFNNGSRYKFKTRMRLSGLGNTNDEVINDEAAEMLSAHQSALTPTVSASKLKNPQIGYVGTPPMAETVGDVFPRIREGLLTGKTKGALTEWSAEKFTDPFDEDAWYETNPSLGYFLLHSAIAAEAQSLSADDFNRMRLGWWSGVEEKRAIKQNEWDALINTNPEYDEQFKPIYAIKFPPDRSEYSLAASLPLTDGTIQVEIVMSRPMSEGYTKIVKWLKERQKNAAKIIIDGQTGSDILYEDLISVGIPKKKIVRPMMKEVVAAHQFMRDAIERGEVSHADQPLLNQTVAATKERSFGRYGGFGWESMSSNISTSAIDAATYAYWGQKVFAKKKPTSDNAKMSSDRWKEVLSNL